MNPLVRRGDTPQREGGSEPEGEKRPYAEADPGMFVGVWVTQSHGYVVITTGDHETSEAWLIPASDPTATPGDIVVAGIPGEEATVKTYRRTATHVVLEPANPRLEPMVFDPEEVTVFGRVVTVLRRL